ncbi:hypothetical protein RRG08_032644 [Elysia crispata]|uniref:Uncharacterized protein n=1 Tax=Elysia crispata TaxID=231223 RepID=A0AAE0XZT4_9GAST|nr:hypothetical protein RRG08_032644 [Elysia crispata]
MTSLLFDGRSGRHHRDNYLSEAVARNGQACDINSSLVRYGVQASCQSGRKYPQKSSTHKDCSAGHGDTCFLHTNRVVTLHYSVQLGIVSLKKSAVCRNHVFQSSEEGISPCPPLTKTPSCSAGRGDTCFLHTNRVVTLHYSVQLGIVSLKKSAVCRNHVFQSSEEGISPCPPLTKTPSCSAGIGLIANVLRGRSV